MFLHVDLRLVRCNVSLFASLSLRFFVSWSLCGANAGRKNLFLVFLICLTGDSIMFLYFIGHVRGTCCCVLWLKVRRAEHKQQCTCVDMQIDMVTEQDPQMKTVVGNVKDDVTRREEEFAIKQQSINQSRGPEHREESLIHTKTTFPRNLDWHSAQK